LNWSLYCAPFGLYKNSDIFSRNSSSESVKDGSAVYKKTYRYQFLVNVAIRRNRFIVDRFRALTRVGVVVLDASTAMVVHPWYEIISPRPNFFDDIAVTS
jgi:hypothetical protein